MRYPDAQWYPGPVEKQGYPSYPNRNAIAGVVLHSMDGNWATGGVNILLNSGTSWHFSILRDGTVLQHYELEACTWHSGIASQNRRLIGIEHEGYHSYRTEPLTEPQIGASVKLSQWIANIPVAWPLVYGQTLFLHKDLGTSDCPGTRFDNILERWTSSVVASVNTNVADQYDVGRVRIHVENMLRELTLLHKEAFGDPQVLHDIIDGKR